MDLKRFVVACAYRAGSPPFPVKSTLPPVLLSFHAATLYAAGSLLVAPPSAAHVAGGAGMYALLTFGITGGHHRYFSHRSYRTSRPFQFAIALLGSLAWQRGPIWWSSHHNHHHLHSDTGRDPHSPVTGSWLWSHMGWYWASAEHDPPLDKFARTWRSFPELAALDKLHFAPGLLLAASLYACGGGGALLWGFVVPVTCCWNSIFAIGSLCHGDLGGGTRRFETGGADTSTNVWHNNHHAFRWSARQGLAAHELDATYAALRALEMLGLVWDLKVPSAEQVAAAERVQALGECAEGGRR